jgi:hypothetical protein
LCRARYTLGQPEFTESIGSFATILFYRTHIDIDDSHTDKLRETTPLVFISNALAAVDFDIQQAPGALLNTLHK